MYRCIFDLDGFFRSGRLRQRPEGTHSCLQHDLYYPGAADHNLCDRPTSATNHVCDAGLRFAAHHHDSDPQPRSDTLRRQVRFISAAD